MDKNLSHPKLVLWSSKNNPVMGKLRTKIYFPNKMWMHKYEEWSKTFMSEWELKFSTKEIQRRQGFLRTLSLVRNDITFESKI